MPKQKAASTLHDPLSAIMGTQAKVAVLRVLGRSAAALPIREVVRRSGMAYRSIDLAIADLLAVGIITELPEGRERRVAMQGAHRLAPVIAALLRAEGDFFPSLRAELIASVAGGDREGLLSLSIVGATALRQERPGEPVELVLVAIDQPAARRWQLRLEQAVEGIERRFGATFRIIAYDRAGARKLWQSRTPRAEAMVRTAEALVGSPLVEIVEALD